MKKRDARLVEIRPELGLPPEATTPMESFQNQTLRPILNVQNALIVYLVSAYLKKYCPKFTSLSHQEKCVYVRDLLKRDSRPKHMLVGIIAGHFTEDEFAFFVDEEPEVRRRLIELCIKRLQDQVDVLCSEPPMA